MTGNQPWSGERTTSNAFGNQKEKEKEKRINNLTAQVQQLLVDQRKARRLVEHFFYGGSLWQALLQKLKAMFGWLAGCMRIIQPTWSTHWHLMAK